MPTFLLKCVLSILTSLFLLGWSPLVKADFSVNADVSELLNDEEKRWLLHPKMPKRNNFLVFAMEIAYGHHEKWDGSGYPQGLSGEDIPISARLMVIVDVDNALISRRVYREPFSHQKSIAIIKEGKGTHFDPEMINALEDIQQMFSDIANTFQDSESDVLNAHHKVNVDANTSDQGS